MSVFVGKMFWFPLKEKLTEQNVMPGQKAYFVRYFRLEKRKIAKKYPAFSRPEETSWRGIRSALIFL